MKTESKFQNKEGDRKMKNLKNVFRIIGIVSAGVLIFGTGAHAAAKQGGKQLNVKARKFTNSNVTKVKNVTSIHQHFRATGPSEFLPGYSRNEPDPNRIPPRPRLFPDHVKGYFKARLLAVQNVGHVEDTSEGIAPEDVLVPTPPIDPKFRRMLDHFEKMNLHFASDRIDPRYLPGSDREPPDGDCFDLFIYITNNSMSNILDPYNIRHGSLQGNTPAERKKINHTLIHYEPGSGGNKGGEEDKETENDSTDSGGKDDIDDKPTEDKPVDDENGSQPDADKDSDPEGDDPDEFRTPTSLMAERHKAAAGNHGSSTGNEGEHGAMPKRAGQGGGLPNDPRNNPSYREPEGGRPDEMSTPAVSVALNDKVNAGHNLQPEPGGDDPDDPRASEGLLRATATSLGYASSPADGGQDGNPGPIGPEYLH